MVVAPSLRTSRQVKSRQKALLVPPPRLLPARFRRHAPLLLPSGTLGSRYLTLPNSPPPPYTSYTSFLRRGEAEKEAADGRQRAKGGDSVGGLVWLLAPYGRLRPSNDSHRLEHDNSHSTRTHTHTYTPHHITHTHYSVGRVRCMYMMGCVSFFFSGFGIIVVVFLYALSSRPPHVAQPSPPPPPVSSRHRYSCNILAALFHSLFLTCSTPNNAVCSYFFFFFFFLLYSTKEFTVHALPCQVYPQTRTHTFLQGHAAVLVVLITRYCCLRVSRRRGGFRWPW